MNTIMGLLKKDLYNLSNYKTSLIISTLVCGLAVIGTGSAELGPILICTILGMIALSTFNYDEMSKSNKYILSLPTNKKEIVKEKYLLAIIASVFGGILGYLITILVVYVMNYIRPENLLLIDYNKLFINTLSGMFGIAFVHSIQIPSIYKWGAEKGRIQMFILLFLVFAIGSGIIFFVTKNSFNIDIANIESFLNRFGILLFILIISLMYFVSYKISCKIYQKKEE